MSQDERKDTQVEMDVLTDNAQQGTDTTLVNKEDNQSNIVNVESNTNPTTNNNKPNSTSSNIITKVNNEFGDAKENSQLNKILKKLIDSHQVLIFSKTWCPFCLETKRTLEDLKIPFSLIELDELNQGNNIQSELTNINGQKTVPHVYIDTVHIGGCNDFKTYIRDGNLNNLISLYRDENKEIKELEKQLYTSNANSIIYKNNGAFNGLFWFPSTVNNHVVRVLGIMSVIICVLGLIFYDSERMHWIIFGLFCDYTIRFLGGATMSPMGTMASLLTFFLKPKFSPGPPKQFASLCGMMFSGIAALLFRLDVQIAAIVVLSILLICAFLEGFLNFCVGCYFFGLAVQFKIIPPSVYKLHLNTKDERQLMYDEAFTKLNEGDYIKKERHIDDNNPMVTDLYYKIKSDEQKQEDFHPIRHLRISLFSLILGITALSLVWKFMADAAPDSADPFKRITPDTSNIIFGASFVLFWIVFLMYLIKLILYPKKVIKEFQHPSIVNFFAAIPMNIIIYIWLAHDNEDLNDDDNNDIRRFYEVMFWICAIINLILFLHINALWIQRRLTMENIDGSWLFLPIANFICVIVGISLDSDEFSDELWLWFSSGILFTCILFPIILLKLFIGSNSDPRGRNNIIILSAVPTFIGLSYESLSGGNDFSRVMYWTGIYLALIILTLFLYRFLGAAKFDESYFSFGFSFCSVAIGAIQLNLYYTSFDDNNPQISKKIGQTFYHVIAYGFIGIANIAVCVTFLHTIWAISQQRFFRPIIPKWGVLSFMRLTHEGFRGWIEKMNILLGETDDESNLNSLNIGQIWSEWNICSLIHEEHARHEDEVFFKEAKTYFPEFTDGADHDHEEHEIMIKKINDIFDKLNNNGDNKDEVNNIKKELIKSLKDYMVELEKHLLWEEGNIQPIMRKYIPNELQKLLVEKAWSVTDYNKWKIFIPWVLRYQRKLPQRILFLKTLMWAMPYRCQQIGLIVYRGCNDVLWADISQQLPEIIPRGVNGWRRQY